MMQSELFICLNRGQRSGRDVLSYSLKMFIPLICGTSLNKCKCAG